MGGSHDENADGILRVIENTLAKGKAVEGACNMDVKYCRSDLRFES